MSDTPSTDDLIRDARGRAAVVGHGTGTGKSYLALADGLVALQRRVEVAEGKVERLREILRESPDYGEGDFVYYEWSRLDEVVNP